jgi:glucose-1-phosphate thymidylyltransferase
MKCIILCAGYATRLYPLTLNNPKALLPVKGKPLLDYTIDKIPKSIDSIIVVTNSKFYKNFKEWSKKHPNVEVLDDGTKSNEERIGGVGDLWLAKKNFNIEDDFLVILGDNLFDFDLDNFVDDFKKKGKTMIGVFPVSIEEIKKMGQVIVQDEKIVSIGEKSSNPKTNLAVTGIYAFTKSDLKIIGNYMQTEKPKEGPTYLIKHFVSLQDVYAHAFNGKWFDIGSIDTYNYVQEAWK